MRLKDAISKVDQFKYAPLVKCPFCNAAPEHACENSRGKAREPHRGRMDLALTILFSKSVDATSGTRWGPTAAMPYYKRGMTTDELRAALLKDPPVHIALTPEQVDADREKTRIRLEQQVIDEARAKAGLETG